MSTFLLEVKGIKKYFMPESGIFSWKKQRIVRAVDGVDLAIRAGETLGLVGESGCGKTTLGRLILKLTEPTSGTLVYDSIDYTNLDRKRMIPLRKKLQMVFQDPYSSLNPRLRIGIAIGEPLIAHKLETNKRRVRDRVMNLLELVGLGPDFYGRYPHEMSGGQRQRVGVARALVINPRLIIADEPVSALDVSIQAQIINMMTELQRNLDLTYLFITHDLRVARYISSRIAVMYLGKIVEVNEANSLFEKPLHPYTKALLSAIPSLKTGKDKRRIVLSGDPPSPLNIPAGCRFSTRCQDKFKMCDMSEPPLLEIETGAHVACCKYMGPKAKIQ